MQIENLIMCWIFVFPFASDNILSYVLIVRLFRIVRLIRIIVVINGIVQYLL